MTNPGGDGYGYSTPELTGMTDELHQSAQDLVSSTKGVSAAPDAGASSEQMAKVYETLLRSGGALAAHEDDTANKIHATNGSYGQVENTNTGQLRGSYQGGGM